MVRFDRTIIHLYNFTICLNAAGHPLRAAHTSCPPGAEAKQPLLTLQSTIVDS